MMLCMTNNESHDDTTARYIARYTLPTLRAMAATYRMDRAHRAPGARILPGRYAVAARIVAEHDAAVRS